MNKDLDSLLPINPSWPRTKIVNSSLIGELAYYPAKERVFVFFKTNSTGYSFEPVPQKVWESFSEAASAGSYFHKHIKSNKNYKSHKL